MERFKCRDNDLRNSGRGLKRIGFLVSNVRDVLKTSFCGGYFTVTRKVWLPGSGSNLKEISKLLLLP